MIYLDDCFAGAQQDFLVCVTVHKAVQVAVYNEKLYVKASLNKLSKHTKSFAKSANPFFNEYFVFEMHCTLVELLRLTIMFELIKKKSCFKDEVVGQLLVDLHSVWNQKNHSFFKKWGRLDTPIYDIDERTDLSAFEHHGYLQIDLGIVSQYSKLRNLFSTEQQDTSDLNQILATDCDDIERNSLQDMHPGVENNIRYFVNLYHGSFVKKAHYVIQISFATFNFKTQLAPNTTTPEWNQQISFTWTYPSLAQRFVVLVLTYERLKWKTVADFQLSFGEIAFKDLPSLGPTYLHFYDPVDPLSYVGRLLMELRSTPIEKSKPTQALINTKLNPMNESIYWSNNVYDVEFLPLRGDHIRATANYYRITATIAEYTSNYIDGPLLTAEGVLRSALHTKFFRQAPPYRSCAVRVRLPNTTLKFGSDFFMMDLLNYLKLQLNTFRIFQLKYLNQHEEQTRALNAVLINIRNRIKQGIEKNPFVFNMKEKPTSWDLNRQVYLLDYFSKLPHELRQLRRKLSSSYISHLDVSIAHVVAEIERLRSELHTLAGSQRVQDQWPDLLLILTVGGKNIAICKLDLKNFLDLQRDQDAYSGNHCWQLRNFLFKSTDCSHSCINCGCDVAIVAGFVSILKHKERTKFLADIVNEWRAPDPLVWAPHIKYTLFKCLIYVHLAKVRPGSDRTGLCDPYLRVKFYDNVMETFVALTTLCPVWNTVFTIKSFTLPGGINWHERCPPLLGLELLDMDRLTRDEVVGKGFITVSVISNEHTGDGDLNNAKNEDSMNIFNRIESAKFVSPPPLKWVPVSIDGQMRAEILMSAEFIQLPYSADRHDDRSIKMRTGIPPAILPTMLNYVLEVVFVGMYCHKKAALMVTNRRINVMMGNLVLSSAMSTTATRNVLSFVVPYALGTVSLPEHPEHWPAIIASDISVSGPKKENTLGAAIISNCSKFLEKRRTIKCHKEVPYTSVITDTSHLLSIDLEEDDVETEDELAAMIPFRSNSRWMRVKASLGFETRDYANRDSLEYVPAIEHKVDEEVQYNWWTKFYNSMYMSRNEMQSRFKHRLVIYPNELEQQAQFDYLQDWATPVDLVHGVKLARNGPPVEDVYATLKLYIKLTPCQCNKETNFGAGDGRNTLAEAMTPYHQRKVRSMCETTKIVVRVYVVQGLQLRPRDLSSASDSYVKLQLGRTSVTDRANYVPNQSNPIFGRFFELQTLLPGESVLKISVYDEDRIKDDLIGSTQIDLEDRWRSKYRAKVGLANEYSTRGYNMWHDVYKPSEILNRLCQERSISLPYFYDNVVEVDGMLFSDDSNLSKIEELHERLSLAVLKKLDKVPAFGYKLVPEHVETRSLYSDNFPGIEQGKLQMWVELFDAHIANPLPIDITPTPPISYEVRVVVRNLRNIQAGDKNIFGKLMSDLYVKGWCQDANQYQQTDIHYRSFAGDAAFNWRMVFPMKYSPNEDMICIRKHSGRHADIEIKRPPIIYLQVWDKDVLGDNDFLGYIELNLSNLERPYSSPKSFGFGSKKRKRVNLFSRRSVVGWFPLEAPILTPNNLPVTTTRMGSIELELEAYTETEAKNSPAGLGRNGPKALEAPFRLDTSFNPLWNPLKAIRHILWPIIRKYVLIALLLVCIIVGISLYFSNIPKRIMSFFTF